MQSEADMTVRETSRISFTDGGIESLLQVRGRNDVVGVFNYLKDLHRSRPHTLAPSLPRSLSSPPLPFPCPLLSLSLLALETPPFLLKSALFPLPGDKIV